MNGSFSAQAMRLGDLLSGPAVYAMPCFQRPYCWTIDEVRHLLEELLFAVSDLDEQSQPGSVFFLGTFVLIKTHEGTTAARGGEAREYFDIIDGQQRLITLTMLIAALRDLARADGDVQLAERMDQLIAFHPGGQGERDYRVALRQRDEAVLVNFAQQMDGCLADADPWEYEGAQREIILNRNFLYQELKSLDRAIRPKLARFLESNCLAVVISTDDIDNAFRIFSVVNQQGKPLARKDLLKAELIGAVPAGERAGFVRRWEVAEHGCGNDFEQFFSHFRTAFGDGRAPIINEIRRLARGNGEIKTFLDRQLLPVASVHGAMLGRVTGQPILTAPALRHVRYLERLSHSDWVPPALLWLHERQNQPADITAFLAALDRAAHAHLLLGLGRDKRLARHGAIIDAIRSGEVPHGERGPMALTAEEQRNIIYNATHDLYDRSSIACKLLLLRLNDAVGDTMAPPDPATVSVEHILPQRVSRTSRWRQSFTDAERAALAGSLGNLALVSPATNKAVRNYDFDKKLELYRVDPEMGRLPVNRGVLDTATFGPEQIRRREARMIEAVQSLFGIAAPGGRRSAG